MAQASVIRLQPDNSGATDAAAGRASPGTSEVTANPAMRLLWRSPDSAQLEIGARAVVLENIDPATVRALMGTSTGTAAGAPGSTAAGAPRSTAAGAPGSTAAGAPGSTASGRDTSRLDRRVLDRLGAEGYIWPRRAADGPAPAAPRLGSELTALAGRHGPAAPEVLAARRRRSIEVHGPGRVATPIAAVLAAAGVGRLHVVDAEPVRLQQTAPAGLTPDDEGRAFCAAAAGQIKRVAPEVDLTPLPLDRAPDLIVLALDEPDAPVDADRRRTLHARGCAHLAVRVGVGHGVVGPLVRPGLTSCLRCADLHRRDRDPAWGALAAQLSVPRRHGAASEAALTTMVAGLAALQALEYLDGPSRLEDDGGDGPAVINGTLEVHLPDWRVRRRTWPPHPACDCA